MEKHCTLSNKWKIFAALLLMVPILAVTGSAQAYFPPLPQDNEPFETAPLPPDASFITDKPEINAGRAKNSKLDSVMMDLVAAAKISNQHALNLARSKSLRLHENRVHVQIITSVAAHQQVAELVASAGGEVTGTSADSTLLQGWLPVDSLETLASNENVHRIQQPAEPVLLENLTAGSSTTEALAAINGLSWHSAGYTGTGVKIAIIDAGFDGYPALLGSDLPPSVTVKNFVDGETDGQVNGTTPHGTACAEIIYDIAPGASLYLVKIGTNLDLQEAVTWAKNTIQVDIISTSLGWYNLTPGDGTGEFADLVQSARDAGILWTTAAGNDREAHWGGAFTDGDNDKYHNFVVGQNYNYFGPGDGNAYLIPAGYTFRVALRWDDWTAVNQDFDLYLYRYDFTTEEWGAPIAFSENVQNGGYGQTPTEYASVDTYGNDTAYGFAIYSNNRTRPVNLEVFAPKLAPLDEIVHARSLANLADAPAAFTVAALDAASPYPQEYYSSEGPTNGPGGTAAGGVNKPDISGFANVSTISYGSGDYKFNGTSSATPHVAGAAALVLSAFPSYTPDQLQAYLQGHAIDMGSPGIDTAFGYGRLYLGEPPAIEYDNQVYLPIIMKPLPAPAAFNKVSPSNGATIQTLTPTLSWAATTPVTRYEYCFDTTNDNACSSWINNGTSISVSLPTQANGTTYYWQVRAWNGTAGPTYANGSATAFWSFTTVQLPAAFNKIAPANSASNQSVTPTLSWGATLPATNYEYCYDTSNDNACSSWINNGTSTSVSLPTLANGTAYYWQVRAWNGTTGPTYANGSATAFWSFTTAQPLANPILNGGFELGRVVWTELSTHYYYLIYDTSYGLPVPPHNGSWFALMGGDDDEIASLSQVVTIPVGRSILHYWFYSLSEEVCGVYDVFGVFVGDTIVYATEVCYENATNGWVHKTIDLSEYAGTTQTIEFLTGVDYFLSSYVFLDDISLETSLSITSSSENLMAESAFNSLATHERLYGFQKELHVDRPKANKDIRIK